MSTHTTAHRAGFAVLLLTVSAIPYAASAQTASQTGDTGAVEQIVVTAQRRSENAQTVPIAIKTLSGQALEDSNWQSLTDLQYIVPGVQYDPTTGSAFQIRGVGSTSFDFSNEKSVNVVVDDVVMDAQRDNGLTGLEDIARVEVLYGPQGTLFGKNSTSGVISVTTNDPVLNKTSAKLNASYGQRNDRTINATVNVPLSSNLAFRMTGFEQGQDGKGRYVTLNRNLGRVDEQGVRAKLLFRPDSKLEMVLAADYERHYDTTIRVPVGGPAGTSFSPSAAVVAAEQALGVTPGPQNADDADGSLGSIKTVNASVSLHIKYSLGRDTLTSITAYRGTQYVNATPADLLPGNIYAYIPFNVGDLNTRKFSEEIHLASPTGQFFEYLLGAFYNKLSANQTQVQWATLGAPLVSATGVPATRFYALTGGYDPTTGALLGNAVDFNSHNETYAAFGQGKINFTDALSLVVGARYSRDINNQSISFFNADPVGITGATTSSTDTFTATSAAPTADFRYGSVAGNKFTYRIAPEFKVNRDVMLYASYSTGYKPAGIAFVGNKYDPYAAETVKAWELGVKSELFDHKLRLNVDAYLENFTNFQATILTPVTNGIGGFILASAIGNAPGLRSRGVEGSFALRPTKALTLSGSVTYNDAYFTDYVSGKTSYTGTSLTNAPHWTASAAADYQTALTSDSMVKAHIDYAYRGALQTVVGALESSITAPAVANANGTSTPNATYSYVPAYSLVNAKLSVKATDRDLEVGFYARNLLNQYFSTGWQIYGALGLLHYTSPNAYRTLGVFVKAGF